VLVGISYRFFVNFRNLPIKTEKSAKIFFVMFLNCKEWLIKDPQTKLGLLPIIRRLDACSVTIFF